ARRLGLAKVLFPIAVGAGSCLGFLAAPPRADRSWSRITQLGAIDWSDLTQRLAILRDDAADELKGAGIDPEDCSWSISVEMRYTGQGASIPVSFPYGPLESGFAARLAELFAERYAALFGGVVPAATPETVTWRVSAVGRQ